MNIWDNFDNYVKNVSLKQHRIYIAHSKPNSVVLNKLQYAETIDSLNHRDFFYADECDALYNNGDSLFDSLNNCVGTGSAYLTTPEKPLIVKGTCGQYYVTNEQTLNMFGQWHKIKVQDHPHWEAWDLIKGNINFDVCFVDISLVQNATVQCGNSFMRINHNGVHHGKGDFVVIPRINGVPDVSRRFVVNGIEFARTFNLNKVKGKCLSFEEHYRLLVLGSLPKLCNAGADLFDAVKKVVTDTIISKQSDWFYSGKFKKVTNCGVEELIIGTHFGSTAIVVRKSDVSLMYNNTRCIIYNVRSRDDLLSCMDRLISNSTAFGHFTRLVYNRKNKDELKAYFRDLVNMNSVLAGNLHTYKTFVDGIKLSKHGKEMQLGIFTRFHQNDKRDCYLELEYRGSDGLYGYVALPSDINSRAIFATWFANNLDGDPDEFLMQQKGVTDALVAKYFDEHIEDLTE